MSKARKGTGREPILDQSPSHLLHRAVQLALDVYAEAVGPGAPTQRQYAVLAAVSSHEGVTQSELVRLTGIDRSTLAELVARMIGKDLLARERSAIDARANAVSLTEAGRAALAATQPAAAAADAKLMDQIGKGKRDAFLAALRQLARAGEKAAAKAERPKPALVEAPAPVAAVVASKAKPAKAVKAAKPRKPAKAEKPGKRGKKAKAGARKGAKAAASAA